MSRSEYCLDCVREEVLVPNKRAQNQSYCTHHVYLRTQRGRIGKSIKVIIDNNTYEMLDAIADKGRNAGRPLFTEEQVGSFVAQYEKQGFDTLTYMDSLFLDLEGQIPYMERAAEKLIVAKQLVLRRLLTPQERTAIKTDIRDKYPPHPEELPYEPRKANQSVSERIGSA